MCKRNEATISSFVYAAIVKAIDHVGAAHGTSSTRELAKGAHLTFPAHASRWLPKEAAGKGFGSVVAMAIAPASVFLSPDEVHPPGRYIDDARTQEVEVQDTFRLARIVGTKQNEHLKSPHLMASLESSGQAGSQGIRAAAQALEQGHAAPSSSASFSTPTLTSQGVMDIAKNYPLGSTATGPSSMSASGSSHWLELFDMVQYGRATSPSVCFSLYSFDGRLNLMVHFDSRRFDQRTVTAILDYVCMLITPCCHVATL